MELIGEVGVNVGKYITDVTNASRMLLMNIKTLKWDEDLLKAFDIKASILAAIKSSESCGLISNGELAGVPISGCLVANR